MTNFHRRIFQTGIVLLVFLLLLFFSFEQQKKQSSGTDETAKAPISDTAFKLNTVVTVTLYDSTDENLLAEAIDLCDKYENLFSRTRPTSELYQLNHGLLPQEDGFFCISPEMTELLTAALSYCEKSGGAFDITIGPVSALWDFTSEEKVVPSDAEISAALPLVDYRKVIVKENRVRFLQEGMQLDLGAIAKGYIADKIKEFLLEHGVTSAVINLGGNVLCVGEKPDGDAFEIGIQKPFAKRSETVSTIQVRDKSIVSSGIYERSFEKGGKFYHHLLNPKTGYPYDNSLVSVTILSEKSVDGDGLSTACFSLGLEEGMRFIEDLPDTEAVFITEDYKLHYSSGFPRS